MSFFADKADFLAETFAKYPPDRKRSAIMPLLRRVQTEEGYVSEDRIEEIAALIESTATEVKSVMSFYSAYSEVPTGKYHLQVCMTLSCALAGANRMWDYLEEKLGIGQGEVTPDGLFSIARVECLGSCGTAPMLQVSDASYFERMSRKRLDALLDDLRRRGDGFVPENDVPPPVYVRLTADGIAQEAADGRLAVAEGSAPVATPPAAPEGGAA